MEIVTNLITTHLDLGGTLARINIVNTEQVLAAHKDPWQYLDVVVRVTGFAAWFANSSPDFRQLVVDRLIRGI